MDGTVSVTEGCRANVPVTAQEVEAVHEQARKDGYDAGYAAGLLQGHGEGMQKGLAEADALTGQLRAMLDSLARPLKDQDEAIEHALVSLAMSVGQHLVRRELKADPGQVIAVIRESLAALPVAASRVRLFLHPDDAALVRERLKVHEGDSQWIIVEDPALTRGGCRVVSETSQVDSTVEHRVATAIASIMGEERDS